MGAFDRLILGQDDKDKGSAFDRLIGGASSDPTAGAQFMADTDSKEEQLRKWLTPVAQKLGISDDPDDPENHYDYRGFFDAMQRGEVKSPDQPGGHWDSRFKDQNHPRMYLLDPTSGRYFNTETGTYTGGDKAEIPGELMDRINGMDTPDLSREQWEAAKGGTDRPADTGPKGPLEQAWEKKHGASLDTASEEALKLFTDGPTFAKALGGAGLRYGLGAATAGPGLMSMLSTILTGSGTGGLAESAVSTAGKGASLGARALGSTIATGKDVATQGALGAVSAAADSLSQGDDQHTMFKRIMSTVGPSVLAELGANFIGGTGEKLGSGLEWAAKKAKNVVAGSNTSEADALLSKLGPTADTDMFGKLLDKYSPTGLLNPKSAAGHLESSVAPQAQVQGQRVGQMIDKAGYDEGVNELVPDAWGRFQSNVDDRALEAMRRPAGGEARDFAGAMANEADEVHKMSTPDDLAEFVRDKSGFQSSGAQKGAVGYAETARAKANQAVGGIGKDAVDELMQNASPETYARWDNARGQKHELEMLQSVLAAKKSAETTAGDIGSTIGSGVLGAGLGAAIGATGDHEGLGAAGGGAAGLLAAFGLTGGATKTAIRQLGGTGLADFGANVARSGGNLARGMGDFAQALPTGAIGADVADENASRGHQAYEVVEQALKANPRMLGSYGTQLAQSQDLKGDVSRMLDDDPQFARLVRNLQAAWK